MHVGSLAPNNPVEKSDTVVTLAAHDGTWVSVVEAVEEDFLPLCRDAEEVAWGDHNRMFSPIMIFSRSETCIIRRSTHLLVLRLLRTDEPTTRYATVPR